MRAFLRYSLGGLLGVLTLWVNACGSGSDKTIIVIQTGGGAGVSGASAVGGQGGAASGGASAGGSGGDSAGVGGSANAGSGSGGDGNAGTMASGGSAGSSGGSDAGSGNGGTAGANGGTAGTTGGTAGSAGSGGVPPICIESITVDQTACTGPCRENTCGIQRLGVRDCTCQGAGAQYPNTYTCTGCDFTTNFGNPIIDPPGVGGMESCEADDATMEDRFDCGAGVENGYRCQSLDGANRMCACWNSVWDCGSKPAVWAGICPGSIDSGVTGCSAACSGGRCGIHNVGVRNCACASVYDCTLCDYNASLSHPLLQAPAGTLPACDYGDVLMEDRMDCGSGVANGYRCQSIDDANRMCACWNSVWDCASKPGLWP